MVFAFFTLEITPVGPSSTNSSRNCQSRKLNNSFYSCYGLVLSTFIVLFHATSSYLLYYIDQRKALGDLLFLVAVVSI